MPKIQVFGCGPGHPDYISPIVGKSLQNAEFIMGCKRTSALFSEFNIHSTDGRIQESLELLQSQFEQGLRCAVLVTGDVGLFSLAGTLRRKFGAENLDCHPGISSIQYACAKLGMDWSELKILSAHGKELERTNPIDNHFVILAGGVTSQDTIQKLLEAHLHSHQFWACQNLSLANESIQLFEIKSLTQILNTSLSLIFALKIHP